MREPTEEQFLKDVMYHQMTIPLNEGVYRHVRFRSTKRGWNQWFDLTTWPGMLTISGDMGTWTFSRLPDMFEFFRDNEGLRINPSYWAEKLQHGNFSGRQGGKVYEFEAFSERLLAQLSEYYGFGGEELSAVTQQVRDEVLRHDEKHAAMEAAYNFEFQRLDGTKWSFDACELPDGMVYSFHFTWCLYAIVWGIQQYDNGQTLHICGKCGSKSDGGICQNHGCE